MSSIAQEESRSISENVRWGKRASYKEGNVSFAYKRFLGYKKNPETGKIEIDEEQAKVVREIYQKFLRDGKTTAWIADYLTDLHVPTPAGKEKWSRTGVLSILTNEKYKGHAILQKTFCDDYLTHEFKVNKGQLPKYHVQDSHPAIIDEDMWDEVQLEIERRKKLGNSYSSTDVFAAKLICEDCGSFYGAKLWHSTDAYAKTIYQCNHKFQTNNKEKCKTPNLKEEEIKRKFIIAYNEVIVFRINVDGSNPANSKLLKLTKASQSGAFRL